MNSVLIPILFTLVFCLSPHLILGQTTRVTTAEYSAYAFVLRGIYKENRRDYSNGSHFVFLDKTASSDHSSSPPQEKYKQLVKNFEKLNRGQATIARGFPRGQYSKTYNLVSRDELNELFREGKVEYEKQRETERLLKKPQVLDICGSVPWKPFYRQFPEASGYYELSRVAFHKGLAMLRIQRTNVCSGSDRTYILSKTNKGWKMAWTAGSESVS